ncbi:MAG: hypothetical protein IT230_13720 [Flavobacteriales bacterium]|nr:hypothetical protein [Flavobacteriales bacterium]
MIHVLLDTNIPLNMLLDPLKRAMPVESGLVMDALVKRRFTGYIMPTTFSNLYFMVKREKGRDAAVQFASALLDMVSLVEQTETVFRNALESGWPDVEDAGQYFAAKRKTGITHLCTTNGKHFKKATGIKVVSPAQLLKLI